MSLSNSMSAALVSCALCLSACAQQAPQASTAGTPRPGLPVPAASQKACMEAERHVKAAQEIHQRMKNAGTPAERRAMMAEHRRALHSAMSAMRDLHKSGMAHGGCAPDRAGMDGHPMHGHRMGSHQAMTQAMMDMMMERIDMSQEPPP